MGRKIRRRQRVENWEEASSLKNSVRQLEDTSTVAAVDTLPGRPPPDHRLPALRHLTGSGWFAHRALGAGRPLLPRLLAWPPPAAGAEEGTKCRPIVGQVRWTKERPGSAL